MDKINPQPRPKRERDEAYLAWIRTRGCLLQQYAPADLCCDIDAHHVREEGKGGIGTKPSDRRTVPLCRGAHATYHEWGRPSFERFYKLDLEREITRLNREYDALNRPARKQRVRNPHVKGLNVSGCCPKGHQHLPLSKADVKGKRVRWLCPNTNKWFEVICGI